MAGAIRTKFPLLAADANSKLMLLGGGGGASKTGVPNSLLICSLEDGVIAERGLHPTGDEAVTSLSVDPNGSFAACVQSNSVVVRSRSNVASLAISRAQMVQHRGPTIPS